MAVIEYDEYKQKLQALEPTLQELEKALAIPKAREELAAASEGDGAGGLLERRGAQPEGLPADQAAGEQGQEARHVWCPSGRTP